MTTRHILVVLALTLSGCDGCPAQFVDAGLMEAQAPAADAPDDDGDGRRGDLVWRQATPPLEVHVSPELSAADHEHVFRAIGAINDLVGATVLRGPYQAPDALQTVVEVLGRRPVEGVVYVHVLPGLRCADAPTKECPGQTEVYHHLATGSIIAATVRLAETAKGPEARQRAVLHELLHTLGLAHDTDLPASIMFPTVQAVAQRVTDHDTRLLRRLYGRTP